MKKFPTAEEIVCETVKKLKDEGVPDEINAYMAAVFLSRARERRAYSEIIKKLIEVEQMPAGAKIFYDK